jgi:PAS domain S-box-containing protein
MQGTTNVDRRQDASLDLLLHVSRELASGLDLRKILHQVLLFSLRSIGGTSGSIVVLDDHGEPIESALVHSGLVYEQTTNQLRFSIEQGLAGWVLKNRQPALIPDTSIDPRWSKRPDDSPERSGAKSALSYPLLARERLAGVITLTHTEPNEFEQHDVDLVGAIADLAGIAIENARLYEVSQRHGRVMTALADSSVYITAALGGDDILQRVLEQIHQALEVESVSLYMLSTDAREVTIKAASGPVARRAQGYRLPIGVGVAGSVARTGEGVIIPEVANDPRFDTRLDHLTGYESRAIAAAPIRSQGEVIGVLQAINPIRGQFEPDALLVLTGIGSLAGSVIRRGMLFDRLQAASKSYQQLFDDNIDPILITDWEGNIVEANQKAAAASGLSSDELRGMKIQQLHQVDEAVMSGGYIGGLSPDIIKTYESDLQTEGGGVVAVQVNVRQILLDEKEHYQWIVRDISESKRLDSLRDDLISMIYHDLRSPLANVLYSLEVLGDMLPEDDGTFQSITDVAVRSVERVQRLTSSLLDVSRLENNQTILNPEVTVISELIAESIQAVDQIIENKDLDFVQAIEPELPALVIDSSMVRRALINLLENAVRYSPDNGHLEVGASLDDGGVRIWVADDGPGIPLEKHETIFDKFARLDSRGTGIGLGLAFCRLAIEAHGGRIWVDGDGAHGSRFSFLLPTAE